MVAILNTPFQRRFDILSLSIYCFTIRHGLQLGSYCYQFLTKTKHVRESLEKLFNSLGLEVIKDFKIRKLG